MVKRGIILSALVGLAGLVIFLYLHSGEEEKIRKQFSLLAKWVSMEPNENVFNAAYKMKNMGDLFTEKVKMKIPDYNLGGEYSKAEIIGYAARARLPFSKFTLSFYDWQISFADSATARVTVTSRITGQWVQGEELEDTRELEWVLKKIEKDWRFSEMEVVEVLKK